MACCEPIVKNFINETITTIPYGDYERSVYGSKPNIDLVYLIGSDWVPGGVFTDVRYAGDVITIDHGGSSVGYAKIS